MNWFFMLYLMIGAVVYGLMDWKFSIGKKVTDFFDSKNRVWRWGVAFGAIVLLSLISYSIEQFMNNTETETMMNDFFLGVGLPFCVAPLVKKSN